MSSVSATHEKCFVFFSRRVAYRGDLHTRGRVLMPDARLYNEAPRNGKVRDKLIGGGAFLLLRRHLRKISGDPPAAACTQLPLDPWQKSV